MSGEESESGRLNGLRSWADNNRRALLVGGLVAVAYFQFVGSWPQVTTSTAVLGVVSGLAALGALLVFRKLADLLYSETWVYLVEVSVSEENFAIYRLNPEKFEDLAVLNGDSLHPLPDTKYRAFECLRYRPEENVAQVTWRGSATELELLESEERIAAVRGELEKRARHGDEIRANAPNIVRDAVSDMFLDMVRLSEGVQVPKGSLITDAVENATTRIEDLTDDFSPAGDGTRERAEDAESDAESSGFRFGEDRPDPDGEPENGHDERTEVEL